MQLSQTLRVEPDGWTLVENGHDPIRSVAVGSNFLAGNGYLGYRGTSPEQTAADFVALVVSDTYDQVGDGWRELCNAPNPLFVSAMSAGAQLSVASADEVETSIDLRHGEVVGSFVDRRCRVEWRRVASMSNRHVLAQRWQLTSSSAVGLEIEAGIVGEIWNLNGEHLRSVEFHSDGGRLTAFATTHEHGIHIVVGSITRVVFPGAVEAVSRDRPGTRRHAFQLRAGDQITVETVAAVVTSNDTADPGQLVDAILQDAAAGGYDGVASASRAEWEDIWSRIDVVIEGDDVDKTALRFSNYHNRICTPTHSNRLPVPARGLSCQAYQGAAFWDQEVFNLPAYLFSEPEVARRLLEYRHLTIDGARRKATRLGYRGAFYAWMSADTGDEVCPDIFFSDVLSGRPIRNHFNDWQMHIAPDVVTTIADYVEVTGDTEFLLSHGAEIAFEVARFLRSFVLFDQVNDRYRCIRLLGPDEWHENVDDNAFTNHQVSRAMKFAIETHEWMELQHPEVLAHLHGALGIVEDEIDAWKDIRDRIHLPQPDPETGLIEQFDGFFELEDITPAALAERLVDATEYWGWPNGIAVATQVSKQADVPMLLWLHRHRFDTETMRANYDYYDGRCAHGSSLSHSAFGMVAALIGDAEEAHQHFRDTATVDLLATKPSVVGGTFIGGIHTAACGGTIQLAVRGFGGLDYRNGRLTIDPLLPASWQKLQYPVAWRGSRLTVTVTPHSVQVEGHAANQTPVSLAIAGRDLEVPPGGTVTVDRR